MNIDTILELFFRGLETSKSWHTVDAYKRNLKDFMDRKGINELDDFINIGTIDLYDYVDELKKFYAPSSINQKIATLKTFYKFLKKFELITHNPAKIVEEVPLEQKLYIILEEDESEKLIETATKLSNTNNSVLRGVRNELIIKIFLETGVRAFELENMKISRINFNNKSILILGKCRIERLVYFSDETFDLILKYLKIRNLINICEDDKDYLFVTDNGNRLKKRMIQYIVTQYVEEAEVSKVSTHKLRHTCASTLKHKGYTMQQIQDKLGHKRASTTERYVHALDMQKAR